MITLYSFIIIIIFFLCGAKNNGEKLEIMNDVFYGDAFLWTMIHEKIACITFKELMTFFLLSVYFSLLLSSLLGTCLKAYP